MADSFPSEDADLLKDRRNRNILEKRKKKIKERKYRKSHTQTVEEVVARYATLNEENASSWTKFSDFPLSQKTLRGLRDNKFLTPTEIQSQSLGFSLKGNDVVGAAKTGSGKTLALIIPLMECLWRSRWTKLDGLGTLVITPTRELAYQIFNCLNQIGAHHEFSAALLIGGTDMNFEKKRVGTMNIVICTPGRLLQHMDENENFSCDNLQMLVIDEADRILDMGFRRQMDAIIDNLPKQRQTLLFSATQTRRVEDLVRVSVRDPVFVSVHENAVTATPDQLAQSYLVCEEEDKINFLWSFLVNHKYKKTLIFVTCCKQARFLTEALRHLRPGLPLNGLWGTQKQNKRLDVFEKFDQNSRGSALIATDIASRGLDFNNVDWVVQLDCPSDVDDYIHRVGRTARMERSGEAVLVLTPSQEEGFLKKLTQRNVPLSRIAVDTTKMADIRNKLSSLMIAFPELKDFAQGSFVAYAKSIHSQKAKDVFDMKSINFDELASSYGLASTPRLRFLKKQGLIANEIHPMEKPNTQQNNDKNKLMESIKETTALNGAGNSDEEEDDFLQITRRNVQDIPEETEAENMVANKRKALTKAQAARKALKSGVPIANKTVFEADEDQKDTQEVTTGKLVLSEAQKEMKEKSKKDKLEHKEILKRHKKIQKDKKKRKANGHNQEDELDLAQSDDNNELEAEADLSWIPDPDKTYESEDDEVEDSEITQSSKKRKSTTDTFSERKKKRRSVENAEEKALALLGL